MKFFGENWKQIGRTESNASAKQDENRVYAGIKEKAASIFGEKRLSARREWRAAFSGFLDRVRPWELITAPFIYGLIVPVALLDLSVTIFQRLCFPVYRLPRVPRNAYISIDRGKLSYLNVMQKLNCVYCAYCNGVFAYASEVAARTEFYWCPIKHARKIPGRHGYYNRFMAYGDGENFRGRFIEMKSKARACGDCDGCSS